MSVLLWVLLIFLVLIVILLFSSVSALVSYDGDGFSVTLRYLFLRLTFPKKKREKASATKKHVAAKPKQKKKGNLKELIFLIKHAIKALGKLLKAIRIRDLRIEALIGAEDAEPG